MHGGGSEERGATACSFDLASACGASLDELEFSGVRSPLCHTSLNSVTQRLISLVHRSTHDILSSIWCPTHLVVSAIAQSGPQPAAMALLSQRLPHCPAVAPHPRVEVRTRAGRRPLAVAASKSAVQTGQDGVKKSMTEAGTRNPSTAALADDVGTPDSSGAGASVLASFDDARASTGRWVSDSILGRAWRAYNRSLESNPVRTKAGEHRCPA